MTQYRLPDWLGAHEVVVVPYPENTVPLQIGGLPASIVAFPGTERRMVVPDEWLTPMAPPEPPNGAVYTTAYGADVWVRLDNPDDPEGRWWTTGNDTFHRWDWVARFATNGGWRRLIPDPADDAPELPWRDGDADTIDGVRVTQSGRVFIEITPGYHSVDEAQLRAAVLLRAVRAAREVEQP